MSTVKSIYSSLLVVILLSTSCHHNDSPSTTCFPSQTTTVIHESGISVTQVTSYQYDDKMNLIDIQGDNSSLTFTYTNGKISAAQSTDGQIQETWSYNDKGLVSHIDGHPTGASYSYTEDLTYNGSGALTKVMWNYTGSSTSTVEQDFVFSNGNVSYQTTTYNSHTLTDSVNYATYDSKRNPALALSIAVGNQSFYVPSPITTLLAVSNNNPTVLYTHENGHGTSVYEYNSNSYPTKITTTFDNGIVMESTIAYANCQ